MCILIHNTTGAPLPKSVIKKSLAGNPDGYARLDLEGKRQLFRTLDYKVAEKMMAKPGKAIHHCRWASMGGKGKKNIHPFRVRDGWYLFQNGTISGVNRRDITDTEQIANVLKHVHEDAFAEVLSHFDSRWIVANKNTGQVVMAGDGWAEHEDMHYSNTSVIPGVLVAVYGSLKEGAWNHHRIKNGDFLCDGITEERHRLFGDHLPMMVEGTKGGEGKQVKVEVYEVPKYLLNELDQMEGHPDRYERRKTRIVLPDYDNAVTLAWVYFAKEEKDNFNKPEDYMEEWPIPKFTSGILPYSSTDTLVETPRGSFFDGEVWRDGSQLSLAGFRRESEREDNVQKREWPLYRGGKPRKLKSLGKRPAGSTMVRPWLCPSCSSDEVIGAEGYLYCEHCWHHEAMTKSSIHEWLNVGETATVEGIDEAARIVNEEATKQEEDARMMALVEDAIERRASSNGHDARTYID